MCKLGNGDIVYWYTKYVLQHDINSFALRRSWGGHENAKMFFAELNCHVLLDNIWLYKNDYGLIGSFKVLLKYSNR